MTSSTSPKPKVLKKKNGASPSQFLTAESAAEEMARQEMLHQRSLTKDEFDHLKQSESS
jgi:hypothetical protein